MIAAELLRRQWLTSDEITLVRGCSERHVAKVLREVARRAKAREFRAYLGSLTDCL